MKFYHLQVKEITKETDDTVSIHFWHPLSEQIKYKAGQFVTLVIPIDGKKVRRSYSMSSSPHADTSLAITIKRVEKGLASNYLNDQIKVGDFVEMIEPMGNFFLEPDADKQRHIVLFGAGSGITPLISIAKSILKMEHQSKISLIYGNKNEKSIIFKQEIEAMEAKYGNLFEVKHILSKPSEYWVGLKGRINQMSAVYAMKELGIDIKNAQYYMCGPSGMMEEIIDALNIYEVPKNHIHRESFHAPIEHEEAVEEDDGSLKIQTIKIIYEGETHELNVKPHQTILEAALDADIDLPYSCQAGMCTACMGKCTSGKVKLDEEDGLTEKELAQGWILTCVAHPLSKDVVIEID
jgi:ring-1,2-phenylacetyl-CoA epoxidase subunit PaaE